MKPVASHVAVMTTPLLSSLKPDLDNLAQCVERLCQSPAEALFPCASTGEFVHLSCEDNLRIMETTAEVNKGRKQIFAGIGASSLAGSLVYLEKAKKLGCDVCVACPPYYYPLSQEAVFSYYRTLCEAGEGMAIMAYHVPFFTTGIEAATLDQMLEELPQLRGIKDSSANLKRIGHIVRMAGKRDDFCVYTGTDDCLIGALACGCHGSMTAFGASMAEHIGAEYAALRSGDLPRAQKLQQQMMPLLAVADALPFPLGYKLLAEETLGMKGGTYLQICSEDKITTTRQEIRRLLSRWNEDAAMNKEGY